MGDQDKQVEPGSSRMPEIDIKSYSLLDPGRMLNDTLIEFYMNYLLDKLPSKRNFHLFNTFFYNKIRNVAKICQTKNTTDLFVQTAKRWDRNVKIFDKDYLVIPICDCHHWLLVIICYPTSVPTVDNPYNKLDAGKPKAFIMIFDSLRYKYMSKFIEPIRSFLYYRWRHERPNEACKNFRDRMALQEINALVPRQINAYDCGIHLLHSFDKFINNPLGSYIKIRGEHDLIDWRPDTTYLRTKIKSLITSRPNLITLL